MARMYNFEEWSDWQAECPQGRREILFARRRAYELGCYQPRDYQAHKKGLHPKLFEAHKDSATKEILEKTAAVTALVYRTVVSYAGYVLGDGPVTPITSDDAKRDDIEREVRDLMKESGFQTWQLPSLLSVLLSGDVAIEPVRWEEDNDGPEEITVEVYPAEHFLPLYPRSFVRLAGVHVFSDRSRQRFADRRVIRFAATAVDEDGNRVLLGEEEVVEHGLGVVPIVHARALWMGDRRFGDWVCSAVEPIQRIIDRTQSQIGAIATRAADPKLVIRGSMGQGDLQAGGHGRILQLPSPDMDAHFLELMQNGILSELNKQLTTQLDIAARIEPALAVSQPGANTSGEAWKWRAMGLPQIVALLRTNIGGAWKEVLGRYRAYKLGEPYDPEWVKAWDWKFADSRDESVEPVRAARELVDAGVLSKEEGRATAQDQGVLRKGFPLADVPVPEETDQSDEMGVADQPV